MWTGIKSVRRAFIKSPWLKVSLVALSLLLLIGSGFWVWRGLSKPLQWQETTTLVNYWQQGEFDYQVDIEAGYLFSTTPTDFPKVTPEEEADSIQYFSNIIEEIEANFTYEFAPDYRVNEVNSDVDIFAIIHGPSGWQKEILLKSGSGYDSCTVSFPLDLENFNEIINDIEDELGVRYQYSEENVYDLVIEARVTINVDTGKEWVTDTFVQPMALNISEGTLTWDNELDLVERRYQGEFSYKHVGNFGYTLWLIESGTALYGTEVTEISSEPYEPPVIISRPPGEVYFPEIVDIMKSSFYYSFACDQPVTNMVAEAEIIVTLEYSEMWQKTFTLVPKTESTGDFVLNFPVDINYFAELANVIRDELGMGAATHDLTIEATVHTQAYTQFGPIDEVFTHTLTGSLGATTLTWSEELEKSEEGTIEGIDFFTDPDLPAYRLWSQIVTGLLLLIFLFVLWHAIWARPIMSKIDEEAFRAKKKHKNVIVDIKELPSAKARETVIPISSLDELIKAADSLLKPVLHQAEANKHTYCVIDGSTRYEYISKR